MPEFKRAYRVEYPESSERYRNCDTLEDALWWARGTVHNRWIETNEFGQAGEYVHEDVRAAVITNRNTGYRWILRRGESTVEFQTPAMFEEQVGDQTIDLHLTIEEAEALARAAKSPDLKDKRTKALAEQALGQVALLCRQVRERVRAGDTFIDGWSRGIPRDWRGRPPVEQPTVDDEASEQAATEKPEKEDLSLKDAAKLLGKARNTLHSWYKAGKFPPAVEIRHPWRQNGKSIVIVPRYRLEAWQAGERMPETLDQVFETHSLHEPPWVCFTAKRGAAKFDIDFWVERRNLKTTTAKGGRRIYGYDLEDDRQYEIVEPDRSN